MTNKYPGRCRYCGGRVPAYGGRLSKNGKRWVVSHLPCEEDGADRVDTIRIGDKTFTRNARGRCEDAPCCGCCTI